MRSISSRMFFRKLPFLVLLGTLVISTCAPVITPQAEPAASAPPGSKKVSFALLEDYEKGDDLDEVALDFALMNELEIDTMRTSFGWDNFEPARGQYDFAWLKTSSL